MKKLIFGLVLLQLSFYCGNLFSIEIFTYDPDDTPGLISYGRTCKWRHGTGNPGTTTNSAPKTLQGGTSGASWSSSSNWYHDFYVNKSWIEFDMNLLYSISGFTPSNIASIKLVLTRTGQSSHNGNFYVKSISSSYEDLNWQNGFGAGGDGVFEAYIERDDEHYDGDIITVDVTNAFLTDLQNSQEYIGLFIGTNDVVRKSGYGKWNSINDNLTTFDSDFQLHVDYLSVIPEPLTIILMGLGFIKLIFFRKK